mgnify:CR=1 FL=1
MSDTSGRVLVSRAENRGGKAYWIREAIKLAGEVDFLEAKLEKGLSWGSIDAFYDEFISLTLDYQDLEAKLGVMEQVVSDIKNAAILVMNEPDIGPQLRPEWVIHRIDTAQEEQVGL